MKLFSPPVQMLSSVNEGKQNGAWVCESKYQYSFFRKEDIPNEIAFFITGKMNVEFAEGGSNEAICRITHIITLELGDKRPMLMHYIMLAQQAPETFNNFYVEQKFIDKDASPVWAKPDPDYTAEQVNEKMMTFYQSF